MKYTYDCYPQRFINPERLENVDDEDKTIIYSCIFTLAMDLKKNILNLKRAREYKAKSNELDKILRKIKVLDRGCVDDARAIYYKVSITIKAILSIFKYCQKELNVNLVECFLKYCKKQQNFFYEVATPIFDEIFARKFNQNVNDNKKNVDRQEYLAICRIACGITWKQNTSILKQV